MSDHDCRTYWGHCGCDLARGHDGPHIGLHLTDDEREVKVAHVIERRYPHLFGEDSETESNDEHE